MAKPIDYERKNRIISHVVANGHAKVNELAELLGVTTETIRKDLAYLQEKKILEKGHGVVTPSSSYLENPYAVKERKDVEAKTQIAHLAASLVPEQGVVFLDSGTTVAQLAKQLNLRNDLTIVTNSMIAAQVLQDTGNQLLVTGGELRQASFSYVGSWAIKALQQIKVDIAFMGCDGFHDGGPSIRSFRELDIKEAAITSAKRSVLLADSSKFQQTGMYLYAPFESFDVFIIERALNAEEKQYLPDSLNMLHP
ncbi:DeoR/GlpR family DNA-binding transcription regulator [Acerihabitans arboris]|uniref:DeoR family transcriptional regulator n=1 Tax=Acerihabitans arboris TaxID=2691583 RepID=A0A845SGC7_9GAMM|nr:DeoR/GlpR family DNA-binding transcription regulator [Acerihabitans arboris]NDL62004.1 DeoR family transcriptional regulator [Acerihabitans arboris]